MLQDDLDNFVMTKINREKIFVVEDDPDILELVKFNLERDHYKVFTCLDGLNAKETILKLRPDLVILDIMLPHIEGLEICKDLRSRPETCDIPILFLSAKSEESDIVVGLEIGADDYLTKPFSPKELTARVRALLRRKKNKLQQLSNADAYIEHGPFKIDSQKHEVFIEDKKTQFTLAEFKILKTLISKPGMVFTRDQLLEKITGGETYVVDRNVDVHIRALRKKLNIHAEWIETIRGIGYKCKE